MGLRREHRAAHFQVTKEKVGEKSAAFNCQAGKFACSFHTNQADKVSSSKCVRHLRNFQDDCTAPNKVHPPPSTHHTHWGVC